MIDHNQQLVYLKEIREMIVNDVKKEDYEMFRVVRKQFYWMSDKDWVQVHPFADEYLKLIMLEEGLKGTE